MSENLSFSRKTSGLVKGLNWWDVFLLVISAPAGSGILYYSVSTASTYPGGNIALSFFIGMVLIFPVIYLAAVTGNMIPRSGSLYVLISRTINPGVGYVTAVLFFLGYTLSIGVIACIVTQVVGGFLANAGTAANILALSGIGTAMQTPLWSTIGGLFLVFLTWFIVLRGIQAFKNVMRILFFVTLAATGITVIYFLVHNPAGISSLFDKVWGAGSYQAIMDSAKTNGWTKAPFSMAMTIKMLLVVLFSYGGLELINYASGETSQEGKRTMRSYIWAWLGLGLIYIIIAFSVSRAFGSFIGAYDFMFKNHPDVLNGIMPAISPSIPFYISSVIPKAWLGILLSVCLAIWLVTTMIPYFFAPSRLIFALAMDRIVPESLAKVSPKTNAPANAAHVTLAFGLLGVFFNLLQVNIVLGTILFCALFVYWLYGLSAILLPYRCPFIYERCPVRGTLFNIPIISLIGCLTFGIGWFVIFVSVNQMSMGMFITLSIFMLIVSILYTLKLSRNQRVGIDMDAIYGSLPPD